ncbi:hypothetical protein [Mycobacterium spongiae]|uniref:hypothetical protein n=1 Tax=Mycobacterium spongiae TaxID=886343 RepID=UPI001BA44286|nr:hypothetical protein [Mycobacterium spongiae]
MRPPKYGPKLIAALSFCWEVLGRQAGKGLAPILPELVPILQAFGELDIDDRTATLLAGMSAATIDRRLAGQRNMSEFRVRWPTTPGSPRERLTPARIWAEWDAAVPGLVELDQVAHDGGNPGGKHAWTLIVTDISTGWTENRSLANKTHTSVLAALDDLARSMPFSVLGIDAGSGSKFLDHQLLIWCEQRQITLIRLQRGNSNDGSHVEHRNWAIVHTVGGYRRYDNETELLLLNKIWALQTTLVNYLLLSNS